MLTFDKKQTRQKKTKATVYCYWGYYMNTAALTKGT